MSRRYTYIAGDWTGDQDLISQLDTWNRSNYWALNYSDVHKLHQCRDTSLPCTIKRSLATRLNESKTFVLIVGKNTDELRKGSCQYCQRYNSIWGCPSNTGIDFRSFVEYECEKAVKDDMNIVVIYNYADVHREKCPECIRSVGTHIAAYYWVSEWKREWNYSKIKYAIEKANSI